MKWYEGLMTISKYPPTLALPPCPGAGQGQTKM